MTHKNLLKNGSIGPFGGRVPMGVVKSPILRFNQQPPGADVQGLGGNGKAFMQRSHPR